MDPKLVLRRCINCRTIEDRRQLWRIVRLTKGGLALDQGMGRSAYLCPTSECLIQAKRRKKIQKSLRCPVPDSIYLCLEGRLK